ncbi:MAG: RNA polymerase sigma factor [Anaerolineaceae bacterium]|nr:RNA polymerase sigma factor [Anaerolineaceae bacterium]
MSNAVENEAELLEQLKNGKRESFAELVDMTSENIYRLSLKMLGNEQDAEDVLQETYIKAFRSIKKFEGKSSLSTWLFRIAVNEALMILRKKQPLFVPIGEEKEEENENLPQPVEIVDWCCLPEHELLSDETGSHLDVAIKTLSSLNRTVFLLRDVAGLSTKEAADVLHTNESNIKTRLFRARMQLREELSSYFAERVS